MERVDRARELVQKDRINGWEEAWKENQTPWDAGDVQPSLRSLIQSNILEFPRAGRAFVPGCGRGYDAPFIASALGLDTVAVDISPTAVQAAKEHFASAPYALSVGKVSFVAIDFFKYSVEESGKFVLAYDHTFFVSMPPEWRKRWGEQMTSLVKPGGYLITIVYPLGDPSEVGPPFHVQPDDYVEPLGKGWEQVLNKVPDESSENHKGRERVVVWKRVEV